MAAPTTRWPRLLLLLPLLLQVTSVCGQLSLGGANSFLPEHLDAAAAITTTGKTLEVTPLVDASTTNAGADAAAAAAAAAEPASDSDLPGASHADGSLTAATTAPPEETTLPDFDDYTADETETTTEHLSSPENHISLTEEADTPDSSAHSKHNAEKLATDAPILTRRIVFTGPEATAAAPQPADQSTRPSSVVRGLDNPSTDFWLPNWPTQLLTNTEEASRRPTVRFPSGSPTAVPGTEAAPPVTPTQSYTVTKVPVTQYYFDLASASPSDIPGPLFDHEDLGVSVSALPSALPDLTQPLAAEDLASSISELQSSVLVNLNGPPLTSTPALHDSVTSAVLATDGPHSISDSTATPTLPAPSSALNEVVGEHIVDNTLPEDAENEGDVAVRETTETPEVLPPPISTNQSGVEDSDHSENITVNDDPSGLQSPTEASDTPEPTSTPQPDAPSPAGPAPPTDSEPVTATSSPTPGDNTPPENNTQHENAIPDDTKVVENDPLMSSVEEERDVAMVSPAGVLVSPPPATASATWTPVVDVSEGHTDTESTSVPASSSVLTSTTLVSPSPPELLSGFTPIISSTQTSPTPNSEAPEGTHTSLSSSTAATLDSTTTASAPTQDLSTLSAPTPTLSSALDLPAVQKTDPTDDPSPTLLPEPVQPEEGAEEGTQQEVPEKESALEVVTEVPPPPPPPPPTTPVPDTTTPDTTTTTTTTTATTTTTTEAATTTTPEEEPTTASSDNTTASTSPLPDTSVNETTSAPGEAPTLTTTVVLENGTAVVVALPYIRALVDYNAREFCAHKQDFRSMFAEWITRDLNGSVHVAASDIRFFSMADCPEAPPLRDGLATTEMEDDNESQGENHTHVYFYVTSGDEADPNLTEKFPLFPTDLLISDRLTYLLPRVMQLEVVRPDESTNQDQLQEAAVGTSVIVIIVICSIVGVTIIFLLFFFVVVKRRGASNNYYGRRCTPVSMDAYSMDSVSVYHSFRRKSKRRASGRSMKSYLNQAFDDPNGPSRPLNFAKLTHFISDIDGVHEEFATIPVNMPKYDELPPGVEDKNRYANVIPVPETRVLLKVTKDGRNCEYINANFVRGARNESKYYIATQAPLDDTVADFWRMIWEQETRVVVMLTDFVEKGIDKCADYLPPSETLDCHRLYGDFQVTLKSRDMREKFVVSNVQLKNLENNLVREVAHMWFTGWPASGVPNEEAAFISYILEVRRTRKKLRAKGPIVVHCSPGTGRTGTFLASDMVMKQFEEHRTIDVPRTVYTIRRDRAGAVQTKEQYAFIYRVINLYASKLTSGNLESL